MRYLVIIFLLTLNGLVWLWGHDHLRSVGLPAPSLSTDASSERPNDARAAKAAKAAAEAAEKAGEGLKEAMEDAADAMEEAMGATTLASAAFVVAAAMLQ